MTSKRRSYLSWISHRFDSARIGKHDRSFSRERRLGLEPLEERRLLTAGVHADGVYSAAQMFDTSLETARGILPADVNGDSHADAVVFETYNADVAFSVLLGDGQGLFEPGIPVAMSGGRTIVDLVSGDLNADGYSDVVTINRHGWDEPGSVSVYLGNGNVTFSEPVHYAAMPRLEDAELCDVDANGRLDLIVLGYTDGEVLVFPGLGDGTFSEAAHHTVGEDQSKIALGDVNGDGLMDIVTGAKYGRDYAVLPGQGDATFGEPITYSADEDLISLQLVDVNGDGRADLITGADSYAVSIRLANADSSFTAQTLEGEGRRVVSCADLDGDGISDLMSGASIWRGNGDGTFTKAGTFSYDDRGFQHQAWSDVNSDGNLDSLSTNYSSMMLVALGDGSIGFPIEGLLPPAGTTSAIVTGDLDYDGHLDLVSADEDANTLSVRLGHGDGQFAGHFEYPTGVSPNSVSLGDVNNDGNLDAIVDESYHGSFDDFNLGTVSIYLGDGNGMFGHRIAFPVDLIETATLVELTGDGNLDLLVHTEWTRSTPETISLIPGVGDGNFDLERMSVVISHDDYMTATGDLNGDGAVDVIAANSDSVRVLLNDGSGNFSTSATYSAWSEDLILSDFDEDGFLDFAIVTYELLVPFFGNGNGTFTNGEAYQLFTESAREVQVADLNGDGHQDLLFNAGSASLSILPGHGDGTFSPPSSYLGQSPVVAADFDGNGTVDLIDRDTFVPNRCRAASVLALLVDKAWTV